VDEVHHRKPRHAENHGIKARLFFSEEKNQKTFIFSATSLYPAMAGIHPPAQT
jgi:hypothetical protein